MSPFEPKRILCAVDLSPVSRQILDWSVRLALPSHATIEVLHASWWEPPDYFTPSQMQTLLAENKAARDELNRTIERFVGQGIGDRLPHEIKVVDSHPVHAILRHAAEARPDLVVMGSHGRTGIARLMMGSVSENVIRQIDVPTLVVRGAPPSEGGRVLCPVGMKPQSLRYLELASAVTSTLRGHLQVVHSVETSGGDLQAARTQLCRFVPADARQRCEILEIVRIGNAAEQIILTAREQSSDLIVLGAERHPFLELTAWGTTADHVLRHSPCSVLVLPYHAGDKR